MKKIIFIAIIIIGFIALVKEVGYCVYPGEAKNYTKDCPAGYYYQNLGWSVTRTSGIGTAGMMTTINDNSGNGFIQWSANWVAPGEDGDIEVKVNGRRKKIGTGAGGGGGDIWEDWSQTWDENVTNRKPVATISSITPNPVAIGNEVTMIGSGSDPDGQDIDEYLWDFGDGTPQQSGNDLTTVKHTYTMPGNGFVTLWVKDTGGKWSDPVQVQVIAFRCVIVAAEPDQLPLDFIVGKNSSVKLISTIQPNISGGNYNWSVLPGGTSTPNFGSQVDTGFYNVATLNGGPTVGASQVKVEYTHTNGQRSPSIPLRVNTIDVVITSPTVFPQYVTPYNENIAIDPTACVLTVGIISEGTVHGGYSWEISHGVPGGSGNLSNPYSQITTFIGTGIGVVKVRVKFRTVTIGTPIGTYSIEAQSEEKEIIVFRLKITKPVENPNDRTSNNFCYGKLDGIYNADGNECKFVATAEFEPSIMNDKRNEIIWILQNVEDGYTELLSDPSNKRGGTITFTYKGLPYNYNSFGDKVIIASWGFNSFYSSGVWYRGQASRDRETLQVFFDGNDNSKNAPWQTKIIYGDEGRVMTDWFVYWNQTGVGSSYARYNPYAPPHRIGSFNPAWPFIFFVTSLGNDGTLNYFVQKRFEGIDLFASVIIHEKAHLDNYWAKFWNPFEDEDGDGVIRQYEEEIGARDDNPYSWRNAHPDRMPPGSNFDDNEVYSYLKGGGWAMGSQNSNDWSALIEFSKQWKTR